jgi:thioesterase domain-containing protein
MSNENLLNTIKPYITLNMKLIPGDDKNKASISISIAENINDKNTMFAGSIFSVMVLSGWKLAYELINGEQNAYDVVIKQSEIDYQFPVKSNATAIAIPDGKIQYKNNGSKSVKILVELKDENDKTCAVLKGMYIGIKK